MGNERAQIAHTCGQCTYYKLGRCGYGEFPIGKHDAVCRHFNPRRTSGE
jgi:hypothetical protein